MSDTPPTEIPDRGYTVTWIINVESPWDAAWVARQIQLDPSNIATHHHVEDETGEELELEVGEV